MSLEPLEGTAVVAEEAATKRVAEMGHSIVLPGWRHFLRYVGRQLVTSLPIAVVDQVAIASSLMAAWGAMSWIVGAVWIRPLQLYLPIAIATSLVFGFAKLYPAIGVSASEELQRAFYSFTGLFASFVVVVLAFIPHPSSFLWLLAGTYFGSSILLPMWRIWIRGVLGKSSWWGQPVLILGGGERGAAAYRALSQHPERGLRPVGIVEDDYERHWAADNVNPDWYIGTLDDAQELAAKHNAFWAVVAIDEHSKEDAASVIDHYAATIPHLLILSEIGMAGRRWEGAIGFGPLWFARIDERLLLTSPRVMKRIMDLTITLTLSIVVVPAIIILAALVKLTSRGPVFYKTERVGLGGRRFHAWKIRSMVVNADAELARFLEENPELKAEWEKNTKLQNDPRITPIGNFLRRSSLDELPQIFNVLMGDMSLVGPRPILLEEVGRYGDALPLYVRVLPGITGLWQVNGRNRTTYAERLSYVKRYVREWSPWLDLYILAKTVRVVASCDGAC